MCRKNHEVTSGVCKKKYFQGFQPTINFVKKYIIYIYINYKRTVKHDLIKILK